MVYKLIIVKTSLITISIILVRNSTCPIKYEIGNKIDCLEGDWKILLIKRLLSLGTNF